MRNLSLSMCIAIFAWKVIGNYAYSPFSVLVLLTAQEAVYQINNKHCKVAVMYSQFPRKIKGV